MVYVPRKSNAVIANAVADNRRKLGSFKINQSSAVALATDAPGKAPLHANIVISTGKNVLRQAGFAALPYPAKIGARPVQIFSSGPRPLVCRTCAQPVECWLGSSSP